MSIQSLDADEWSKKNLGLRGMGAAIVVSEPGVYKLIARSNKPEAKKFDRWVRHEVLPAIRKDGMYVAGEEKVVTGEMTEDELILRAMEAMQRKDAPEIFSGSDNVPPPRCSPLSSPLNRAPRSTRCGEDCPLIGAPQERFEMNNLTTFNYLSNSVRVVEIDGNPWFVAMDVCRVLGFHVKTNGSVNVTHAIRHCNDDEIITHRLSNGRKAGGHPI